MLSRDESGWHERRIWVLVLNYEGAAYLGACLESLLSMELPPGGYTCVVIDNASRDGSVDLVRRSYPTVQILETGQNLGYAGGNNVGLRRAMEAGAEYVGLVNMDVTVDRQWLVELVRQARVHPDAAILGSRILRTDGTLEFDGAQFDPTTTSGGYASGEPSKSPEPCREAFYACGAAMLVQTRALRQVGLFDPVFFAYHEDVDLALRCWTQGYRVLHVPAAVVRHVGGGAGAGQRFRDFMGMRNSLLTVLKLYDRGSWLSQAEALLDHFLPVDDVQRLAPVLAGLHQAATALRHRRSSRRRARLAYGRLVRRLAGR